MPITSAATSSSHEGPAVPPDYVPPGAPADIGTNVDPELLTDFADRVTRESWAVGGVRRLSGIAMVEDAVPGATLISGCTAFRQTTEDLVGDLYDELSQLYLNIHGGLSTIKQADEGNAANIGQAGCK